MPQLACPGCKQNLGEDRCPQCGLYLVIDDANPPWLPRLVVGDRLGRLWDITVEVARGTKPATNLGGPIAHVEEPLRNALTDPLIEADIVPHIHNVLDALAQVRAFVPTRDIALLNRAWAVLGPAATGLRQAAESVGIDMNDGKSPKPSWAADISSAFVDPRDTFELSEPDDEDENGSGVASAFNWSRN